MMYREYYGLSERPFELTANPNYLYLTPVHREALSNLQYGLAAAKAVTLLIGEAGTGKTTLLNAALVSDRCRHVRGVQLNNPSLTRSEFIELVARRLNLSATAATSKAAFLEELESALRARRSRGEIIALIVDEAQSMNHGLLEEIRLLANIETMSEKLLPIVLVGQPDLGARLEEPKLRQLKQRVALRCEITPFDLPETATYIAARVHKAGGVAVRLFTREAVMLIHAYSGGIPRTINVICDNALVHGVALGCQPVGRDIVLDVCRDFSFVRQSVDGARPARQEGQNGVDPALRARAPSSAADSSGNPVQPDQVTTRSRFRLFDAMRQPLGR
jgi:general secretion pathway protein A